MTPRSTEFFYIDENGNASDAKLHDELLNGVDEDRLAEDELLAEVFHPSVLEQLRLSEMRRRPCKTKQPPSSAAVPTDLGTNGPVDEEPR